VRKTTAAWWKKATEKVSFELAVEERRGPYGDKDKDRKVGSI